tara:strand:+ start:375 stop:620 length:246 start_codon:yes stop_codon:yes gene_type:complete
LCDRDGVNISLAENRAGNPLAFLLPQHFFPLAYLYPQAFFFIMEFLHPLACFFPQPFFLCEELFSQELLFLEVLFPQIFLL